MDSWARLLVRSCLSEDDWLTGLQQDSNLALILFSPRRVLYVQA